MNPGNEVLLEFLMQQLQFLMVANMLHHNTIRKIHGYKQIIT